ncbi:MULTISPECIES: SusC/RagA family TonB-linked outer membrane protein [Rufibacter]|uniref:TonB-linked SusC/RagA family outer membrane protein n=1 Tax=Rufibacter quisquiliarum TaxID=1549639 RepID=A0A839GDG4_9BACT|nr:MULTISPECIES: SusC/RagA family TonB-linked outer membrane protein [Rufibacter]MBA9077634.1 TonB-linked SusC/RagA family outer membrane protein [Rufibacter quisquiliarum]
MIKHLLLLLLLVIASLNSFAQIRITGQVTSGKSREALPGVTVLEKGSPTNGASTGADGQFSITVPGPNSVLVFSFIGFVTREVTVGNQQTINVILNEDARALDEVVVTAFGVVQERKALTYAVQEVDSKLIQETNQPNALNALRGRVAGVSITSAGGTPGAGSTIVIRGINSLNPSANNQPLFVIDGVPVSNQTDITGGREGSTFTNSNRFADINPDDIASISVLKGPAASALYGLRASNGAVIITTKSGQAGKTTFNYRTSVSFDDVYRTPPMQDKYGRGFNGIYNPADYRADGPPIPAGEPVYDQWDQVFNTGHQYQNNFSFSGGTDKATFYGSLGRLDQTGVVPNSEYERTTAKIAGTLQATERLKIDASANFINSNNTNPRNGVGGSGVISYASRYAPDVNIENYLNPDGTQNRYTTQLDNPLFFAENAYQTETLNRIIGNMGLNYRFTDWLALDYRAGIDYYGTQRNVVTRPTVLISATSRGSISEQYLTYQEINSNLLLTGDRQLNENFGLTVSLGNQVTMINTTDVNGSGTNFILPDFNSVNNLGQYTVRSYPSERNIIGVFGDAKLNYRETVFLNVTGRNDWSSTLPKANRSFFYPSVSLAYIFSETLGLSGNRYFNYGKLRASYAEVGKDAAPYLLGNYYTTQAPFLGVAGVRRSETIGSETLRPERTKGFEFGVELAFLGNRLRLDANYAIQNSVDQIVPIPTSRSTGFSTYVTNAGEIQNRVLELVVDADVIKGGDFSWNTIFNFSRLRGEVLEMPEGVSVITFQPESPWVKQRIQPGGRPGDWYGWKLSRVEDPASPANGRLVIVDGYPNVNNQWKGAALSEDTYLGNAFPDFEGGWNNTLRYKNFELSFLFNFRKGGYAFDINRRMRYGSTGGEAPTGAETELRNRLVIFDGVVNTGTTENPVWVENTTPVVLDVANFYSQAFRYRLASEYNGFQEASVLRLQNVSLSYTLPKGLLGKTPFSNVTASVTGNNLWMSSPFVGFDPEQSAYGPGSNVFGYVGTNIPATRSVYFGLNFSF